MWDAQGRTPPPPLHYKNNYFGWTVGAGIEQALTEHLSVKLEYSYADLGKKQFNWKQTALTPAGPWNVDGTYGVSLQQHDFKVGLTYRF
jgi:outer membrane immunogenic protein